MSITTVEAPGLVAGTWDIDVSHSEVGFTVRHVMVSKVKGTFKTFDGTITIDDDPLQSERRSGDRRFVGRHPRRGSGQPPPVVRLLRHREAPADHVQVDGSQPARARLHRHR